MTVSDLISNVYLLATGKTTTLTVGTSKYDRILALLNFFTRQWATERGVSWASLYDPAFSIGTITATDAYDLDTETIQRLSDRQGDYVRVVWTDGVGYTDYTIVPAIKLKDYSAGVNKQSPFGWYCAQIGSQLVFNHKFVSTDPQYGGTIYVPIFVNPDTLTAATDDIQVDDPDWLVAACAAEYVRNDITRQGQYQTLAAMANQAMQVMKDNEEGELDTVDRPWSPIAGLGTDSAFGSDNIWSP